jgi:hypothetical protein
MAWLNRVLPRVALVAVGSIGLMSALPAVASTYTLEMFTKGAVPVTTIECCVYSTVDVTDPDAPEFFALYEPIAETRSGPNLFASFGSDLEVSGPNDFDFVRITDALIFLFTGGGVAESASGSVLDVARVGDTVEVLLDITAGTLFDDGKFPNGKGIMSLSRFVFSSETVGETPFRFDGFLFVGGEGSAEIFTASPVPIPMASVLLLSSFGGLLLLRCRRRRTA